MLGNCAIGNCVKDNTPSNVMIKEITMDKIGRCIKLVVMNFLFYYLYNTHFISLPHEQEPNGIAQDQVKPYHLPLRAEYLHK